MRDGEVTPPADFIGWPKLHFAGHKRRFVEFDAATLRAMLALRSAAQRVENAIGGWFPEADMTPQKFGVLIVLSAESQPVSLSELRRYLGTTQANVTGLIAGLERSGLIERKVSRDDRRVSHVSLSRTGRRLVEGRLPDYFARNRRALRGLTPGEKRTLVDLLERVARGFEDADA